MFHEIVWFGRQGLIWLLLSFFLNACTISSPQPNHSFSFDGWFDHWADQVDLLEYKYGDRYRMVQRAVTPMERGLGYKGSVNGPMPVGEFLYVKWRLRSNNQIFEERVDLRNLFPRDMTDYGVTFVIDGRQLYVYLVTPVQKSRLSPPILKTYESKYHVTYEIYPNNTFKK